MKKFKTILTIEGGLLAIAGLIHIVFLSFIIDKTTVEASLFWVAMFFGVAYLIFGLTFLAGRHKLLLPTLIINALGLTGVIIARENSPFWMVDPKLVTRLQYCTSPFTFRQTRHPFLCWDQLSQPNQNYPYLFLSANSHWPASLSSSLVRSPPNIILMQWPEVESPV